MEETLKASMQAIIEKEKEVRKYIRKHIKAGKEAWDMWSDFVCNCTHTYTDNEGCRFCRHIDTTNGLCNVSFNCPDYIKEKEKETQSEKPNKDNEIHPVRFTYKEFRLIKHIMGHFSDYFEEESEEFFNHVEDAEREE